MPLALSLSKCGGKEYALYPNLQDPWLHSNMAGYKTKRT
jgi:hypothetical protein